MSHVTYICMMKWGSDESQYRNLVTLQDQLSQITHMNLRYVSLHTYMRGFRINNITHVNPSVSERIKWRKWMRHIIHTWWVSESTELQYTYKLFPVWTSQTNEWMRHATHTTMTHKWTSHTTYMNESWHTHTYLALKASVCSMTHLMCHMAYLLVWHVSFICVIWLLTKK